MPHKFISRPTRRILNAPPGLYVVTAKLPMRTGEFEYRIKHISGLHEFTARENELRWVEG
jgi:hypothetical protein